VSYDEAKTRAQILRGHLLAAGVETVSIELVPGRGGSGWSADDFVATLGHHIVTTRSQGNTPGLKLVKVGRADLPGPLCNGYGGFDEVARIICMAWANHPGQGGPFSVEAGTIPENNGRPYLFGWEFEGGIDEEDFTPSYRRFMARCLAGTLSYLGRSYLSHLEHKHWAPGRKVDRLGYSMFRAAAEIKEVAEDMPQFTEQEVEALKLLAADGTWLNQFVDSIRDPGPTTGKSGTPRSLIHVLELIRVMADKKGIDPQRHLELASAILGQ
jgi:hypothetical protein